MIYALVLTAPGRTLHHVSEGYLEYHAKSAVAPQANGNLDNDSELAPQNSILSHELKGVCKELYEETKSLRLKFNPKVMFSSHSEDQVPSTERFLRFFATLPAEQRQLVHEVELCSGIDPRRAQYFTVDDGNQLLLHLADVCRYNPHINVKYRLTCFNRKNSSTAARMAYNGGRKRLSLRCECIVETMGLDPTGRLFVLMESEYLAAIDEHDVPLPERDLPRLDIPNLRFYPMSDILSDADDMMFKNFGVFFGENGRDMMPFWEQLVHKWLSEGF